MSGAWLKRVCDQPTPGNGVRVLVDLVGPQELKRGAPPDGLPATVGPGRPLTLLPGARDMECSNAAVPRAGFAP